MSVKSIINNNNKNNNQKQQQQQKVSMRFVEHSQWPETTQSHSH